MSRVLRLSLCTTLLLVLVVLYLPGAFPSPLASDRPHGRSSELELQLEDGKRGAVASESAICSRHGTDIILMGGNAADAVSFFAIVYCLSWVLLFANRSRWSRRCSVLELLVSTHLRTDLVDSY
jgi:gamma-glutamyltranspeptidase/glutathione hydrolase